MADHAPSAADARADGGSAPIAFRAGAHRICDPEATLERIAPLLRAAGVTRTANVTGLDRIGLPVVMAARPNARSISVSHGKGTTLAAATASAQMEAIETHVAEMAELPRVCARLGSLPCDLPVIDWLSLPRASEQAPPADEEIGLCPGTDLMSGEALWAPEEVVQLNYTLPLPAGHGWLHASSNGLASGNSEAEAIVHGLCEIVERACQTRWLADPRARSRSRIDPDSIAAPELADLVERFRHAGLKVWIWDITGRTGIAAFMCSIAETGRDRPLSAHLHTGSGCHPDRTVALSRAMTEAAQMRMTYLVGARDDQDHGYFTPGVFAKRDPASPGAQGKRFDEVPSLAADTHAEEIAHILARLRADGCASAFCLRFPVEQVFGGEPRISVVRVVVPGMPGPPEAVNWHLFRAARLL